MARPCCKAAVAGGYKEAAGWMADLMFLANNNAKKPSGRSLYPFEGFLCAIGQINRAAAACQRAILLKPHDKKLLKDLKRLRAKLGLSARPAATERDAAAGTRKLEADGPAVLSPVADREEIGGGGGGGGRRTESGGGAGVLRQGAEPPPRASSTILRSTCTWMG